MLQEKSEVASSHFSYAKFAVFVSFKCKICHAFLHISWIVYSIAKWQNVLQDPLQTGDTLVLNLPIWLGQV